MPYAFERRLARVGTGVRRADATESIDDRMRAIIADDERLMREQLRTRLAEVWPELEIVAEAKNGAEAVEAVFEHRPDLAFLDIRMPGMTGVEAAREIGTACHVVFITAYSEYAVEAFQQGAVDYVLKPPEPSGSITVGRLKQRVGQKPADLGRTADVAVGAAGAGRRQARPGQAAPAMDPGFDGPAAASHPGDGSAVLHLGREVHARADRRL